MRDAYNFVPRVLQDRQIRSAVGDVSIHTRGAGLRSSRKLYVAQTTFERSLQAGAAQNVRTRQFLGFDVLPRHFTRRFPISARCENNRMEIGLLYTGSGLRTGSNDKQ